MIARVWRGRTRAADLATYRRYVEETGLSDYFRTAGNRGAFIFTRIENEVGEIVTLSFWDSLDSIRAFAGDDINKARYYPEDEKYLLDFPEFVEHYDAIGSMSEGKR